ncbi:MAG TPA: DUF427 domain-containing protein [Lapillicoccus sp.]|uniref:DUF427 domain-containing protein n=1 Tax=Lapillicoccus sp. TaxID=1909287 RepID=UPI002F91E4B2
MSVQMMSVLAGAMRDLRQHPAAVRVRAEKDGTTVVDTFAARLVWEPRRIVSAYAVPVADIGGTLVNPRTVSPEVRSLPPVLSPRQGFAVHSAAGTAYDVETAAGTVHDAAFVLDDPDLEGYAVLNWDAFTRWFEEGEEVRGHPREPFHSIRCLPSDRHVVVEVDGQVLADTTRAVMLVETTLPARWYIPREDVRMDLLAPSDSHTICAYKGQASYWSYGDVEDIVWTYDDPRHEAAPVRGMLSFYAEHTDYIVDGERIARPVTEWSQSRT